MDPITRLRTWIAETLRRRAVRNLGFIYSSRLFTAALRLGASIVIARILGAEKLGILTIAAVILGFSAKLFELGLMTTMIRKLSHHLEQGEVERGTALVRRVMGVQALVSGAVIVGGWYLAPVIAIRIYSTPDLVMPLRLAFVGAFVYNLRFLVEGILRAHERFRAVAVVAVIEHVGRTALVLLLAWVVIGLTVNTTMLTNVAEVVIGFAVASILIPRRYFTARVHERYPLREVFSYSGWMYLFSLTFMLFDRLDVLMLGYFRAGAEVGVYSVAFRLILPFEMIPETINTVFLPKVSRFTSMHELMRYFRDSLKVTCLVGLVGVVMLFLARPLILTFYGAEYAPSVELFQILVGAFILLTILNPFTLAGHTINKPQLFVIMAAINLVLNFVGNLIFIPRYGAVGAAIVTLVSRVLGGVAGLFVLKWFLDRWRPDPGRTG